MALVAQQSISVVFPAYNEEGNIKKVVEQTINCLDLIFPDWEIIVVNDGSRDRTGALLDELSDKNRQVTVVHHAANQGYGAALKSGILRARKELIFFCDSDLQFHLSELLLLVTWIEQCDIVIGYRAKRNDRLYRKLNAWGWRTLVRALLGLKVKDIDCAFKLFRASVFERIKIDAVGAMVNTDILVQAFRMGFKVKEVPVTHFPRVNGTQTGANLKVILRAFKELYWLYFKLREVAPVVEACDRRRDRKRIDFPDRRKRDQRQVVLPINFSDRRRRRTVAQEPRWLSSEDSSSDEFARSDAVAAEHQRTVAMVVASPFPANHGTPGSIREMAEAMTQKGHRVHVVTYHFGDGEGPRGVRIHRIWNPRLTQHMVVGPTWQKPLLDFLMIFTLCRVILREKADLIHAHNYEGALVGYIGKIFTGRPLIYNAINTMEDELPTYNFLRPKALAVWLARQLDYWVPRTADHILCLSEDLARFLIGKGIQAERIHVVPLGVNEAQFNGSNGSTIRSRLHLEGIPLVVYTGILDRLQRIDYLVKAMSIVVKEKANARLLIVSNVAREQDLQECRAMSNALGLNGAVEVLTNISFEDVPSYLNAADVAVVSRPDCPGFPVKLLNYMAAGKPIVVFDGSAKGLKHGVHAMVVKDHDWQAMGHGILRLLHDPGLAEKLGGNVRQLASQEFGWMTIVTKIEHVYDMVLADQCRFVPASSCRLGSPVGPRSRE